MREYLVICNNGNSSREVNHGDTLEVSIINNNSCTEVNLFKVYVLKIIQN